MRPRRRTGNFVACRARSFLACTQAPSAAFTGRSARDPNAAKGKTQRQGANHQPRRPGSRKVAMLTKQLPIRRTLERTMAQMARCHHLHGPSASSSLERIGELGLTGDSMDDKTMIITKRGRKSPWSRTSRRQARPPPRPTPNAPSASKSSRGQTA